MNGTGAKPTEVVTTAQMRAIERAAIDSGSVTGLALMERAGAAVVAAMLGHWPDLQTGAHRAVVLCGPGNNGGDGFVVARLLRDSGWAVAVLLLADPAALPPDAAANLRRWQAQAPVRHAGKICDTAFAAALDQAIFGGEARSVVVIDALFGIGLSRAPVEAYALLHGIPAPDAALEAFGLTLRRVAIDLPTGLGADDGRVLPAEVSGKPWACPFQADLTVTFHAAKPGHLQSDGPHLCGRLVVADIGLGPWDPHRHDA